MVVTYFSPHYLIKETISGKKKNITEHKMYVSIPSTNVVQNTSHSKKNSTIYRKCTQVFMPYTTYSCKILIKLEFSRQIFAKILKYKIS